MKDKPKKPKESFKVNECEKKKRTKQKRQESKKEYHKKAKRKMWYVTIHSEYICRKCFKYIYIHWNNIVEMCGTSVIDDVHSMK